MGGDRRGGGEGCWLGKGIEARKGNGGRGEEQGGVE